MSKQAKGAREGGQRGGADDAWSELSSAALALENELRKFEQLAAAARRMPLDTRKALERAARATAEAAQGQEEVNAALGALVHQINQARLRHEANAKALGERGEEIRLRHEELMPFYERFAELGEESRAVNGLVQEAAAAQREASTPERVSVLVAFIEGIEDRMGKLVESARDLSRESAAAGATDLAEQSDSIRQQAAGAKNKLGLLRKGLTDLVPAAKPN